MLKTCKKCNKEKLLIEFVKRTDSLDGYRHTCKHCDNIYKRTKYCKDKERIRRRNYRKNNPEKNKLYEQHYRNKNRDNINKNAQKWRQAPKNKQTVRKYINERYKTDIEYKLKVRLRQRLHRIMKSKGIKLKPEKEIGCTLSQLKTYLEQQFVEGMNWDNYGEWHIDHIKPIASFDLTNNEEFKLCCHFTNLQPMWALDNIKKGDKV